MTDCTEVRDRLEAHVLEVLEAVAVPNQDREAFEALMDKALAVDTEADPRNRLMNVLAQRRARWLREREDELFF